MGRRAARHTAILLLSSASALVLLAYAVRHPPRRVRRAVSRFVKAHPHLARFRVGERVLVRWAYEDLELEEGGYGMGA